jgi:hypothetical protein
MTKVALTIPILPVPLLDTHLDIINILKSLFALVPGL